MSDLAKQKKEVRTTPQSVAAYIIEKLRGKLIIHRYNAVRTNSIYLKFDYGVACSLRISDHLGYDYLSDRYNIVVGLEKPYIEAGDYPKEFFPPSMADEVIQRILMARQEKMARYLDYGKTVRKEQHKKDICDKTKSFWKGCKEIK